MERNIFELGAFILGDVAARHIDEEGYDSIQFEGILCSTQDEDGDVIYFTVNKNGKALQSYTQLDYNLQFSIKTKAKVRDSVDAPHLVEVIRHIRCSDLNLANAEKFSARGGATFRCVLNYNDNSVTVYPAFCSPEDNYNKRIGILHTIRNQKANMGFVVQLAKLSNDYTLTMNIMDELYLNRFSWTSYKAELAYSSALTRLLNND